MQCEQCNADMRLIPAGFSKAKNKPYPAFYACDQCKATKNLPRPPLQPNPAEQRFNQGLDKDLEDKKWNGINKGKCRHAYLLEEFKQGKELTPELVAKCNDWAEVSMTGALSSSIEREYSNTISNENTLTEPPF